MPTKTKRYNRVLFSPEIIGDAFRVFEQSLHRRDRTPGHVTLSISLPDNESWLHDSEEEFFADYRKKFSNATFAKIFRNGFFELSVSDSYTTETTIVISLPSRTEVERVFGFFEDRVHEYKIPEPPQEKPAPIRPKIFIGHGHSSQWRDLKDHLHDMQGYDVEAYEVGPRAGFTVSNVLQKMLTHSSLALLVLTAEDEGAEGEWHARENVIHELGLFQGKLGWPRAIALVEEGVTEFSNIHGTNQIRFAKGQIETKFGDVVATIKREFEATH